MRRCCDRLVGCLIALAVFGAPPAAVAQDAGPAAALERVLVGDDPMFAIMSDRQLEIFRQSLAVDINSLPMQTALSRAQEQDRRIAYGPIYLHHAIPMRARTLDVQALYQHASWRSIDSIDLDGGELRNYVPSVFGRSSVDSRAALQISSDTLGLGARYALFGGADGGAEVGLVLPVQHVCVRGARMTVLGTGERHDVAVDSCGTGIGDLQIGGKYTRRVSGLFVATHGSVALATGNADELTGKGTSQGTLTMIASRRQGVLQPHINVGVTVGGHGVRFRSIELLGTKALIVDDVSAHPSFNYGAGLSIVVRSKATITTEITGRSLRHGVEFEPFTEGAGSSLELRPRDWQDVVIGLAGARVRVSDRLVLSGHAARQLSESGLRSSWVAGVAMTVIARGAP